MNKIVATDRRRRQRHAAERRFRRMGAAAVLTAGAFLLVLLGSITAQGWRGFTETRVTLTVDLAAARLPVTPAVLRGPGARFALAEAGLEPVVAAAGARVVPGLLSDGAWLRVRDAIVADPSLLGKRATFTLPVSEIVDQAWKRDGTARGEAIVNTLAPALSTGFAWSFLAGSDATDPTRVGIWGALKGSLLVMAVTLGLAFPIGTLAALYLEEYAGRSGWTDLIEVAINNLAAVPSIIFGLLGLAFFLGTLGLPRSAPLVGGLTLALMTLPIIVIAARAAIRSVPLSVREAALAVGASRVQVVFHHVLPLAMPGILTGTIIGAGRALGETAPLLMIGMRAFIAAPPGGVADPATALPVQIFLWSDEIGQGFVEKTSAAIIVLLAVLLVVNAAAISLRHRLQVRW